MALRTPVGARTLQMLCRKARGVADNGDVAAAIRSFMVIHLHKMNDDDLAWLDRCFWDFMPRLHEGMTGTLRFARIEGWFERAIPPPRKQIAASDDDNDDDDEDSDSDIENDASVQVAFSLDLEYGVFSQGIRWYASKVTARRDYGIINTDSGRNLSIALLGMREALEHIRPIPDISPPATMEVPSNLDEWREFFRLWLFRPGA